MKEYFHAWNLVFEGLPRPFWRLLKYFADIKYAWEKGSDFDLKKAGIRKEYIQKLKQLRNVHIPFKGFENLKKDKITLLTFRDTAYPFILRSLNNHLPPVVLYLQGTLPRQDQINISIVGTRQMTGYGESITKQIIKKLSCYDMVITSGMARGIDMTAHTTALKYGLPTIAILGYGLKQIPFHLRKFVKQILEKGALISEFPPFLQAQKYHFPLRNRIISGLSKATIVVEAGEKSGALITAQYALDQGREVLAVPGDVTNEKSKGTNRLIQRSSAHPLCEPEDILDILSLPRKHKALYKSYSQKHQKIINALEGKHLSVNELIRLTKLTPQIFQSALTELELEGIIQKNIDGKYFLM